MKSMLDSSIGGDWFQELMGFEEKPYNETALDLRVFYHNTVHNPYDNTITSRISGDTYACGALEIASLYQLMIRYNDQTHYNDKLKVNVVQGNIRDFHVDPANAGALFQVASQFNLLEMVSPLVKPSDGITIYEQDMTQGPVCAMACGAGTVYRNYFAQTDDNQINCLSNLEAAVGNGLWVMQNGYPMLTDKGIELLSTIPFPDRVFEQIQYGIHRDTQVTIEGCNHRVNQIYCSAIPLGYYDMGIKRRAIGISTVVLKNAYLATMCEAAISNTSTGNNKVFLTLLGDGAFENARADVLEALVAALSYFSSEPLEVSIVCYTAQTAEDVNNKLSETQLYQ